LACFPPPGDGISTLKNGRDKKEKISDSDAYIAYFTQLKKKGEERKVGKINQGKKGLAYRSKDDERGRP